MVKNLGGIAFLAGLAVAVIAGFTTFGMAALITGILALVVAIYNIKTTESNTALLAGILLVLAGPAALSLGLPIADSFLLPIVSYLTVIGAAFGTVAIYRISSKS